MAQVEGSGTAPATIAAALPLCPFASTISAVKKTLSVPTVVKSIDATVSGAEQPQHNRKWTCKTTSHSATEAGYHIFEISEGRGAV
jgi:hypothetical protein